MTDYLLVAADFVRTGGMDAANHALASYLAGQGRTVHLLAHSVCEDLAATRGIVVHHAPKIASSYLLSEPLVDRLGRRWASRIARSGGRVIVNGGNCRWGDVNWVHYVHAAYTPAVERGALVRWKWQCAHRVFSRNERASVPRARIVIANSNTTKLKLIERLGIPENRIHTVYYGIDPDRFRPPSSDERAAVRHALGWPAARPVLAFVGALGDRRKGFDTIYSAWRALCADPVWDADLAVVGAGAELPSWRDRAAAAGLGQRIRFLGFRRDVPEILAAADGLVAPTRYEAYGLGVHEALCCGLPAFVSRLAGVAERYPAPLEGLLIANPDDPQELACKLRAWRTQMEWYRNSVSEFSATLRQHTWAGMAATILDRIERVQ